MPSQRNNCNVKGVVWLSVYWYLLDNMNYKETKTLGLL